MPPVEEKARPLGFVAWLTAAPLALWLGLGSQRPPSGAPPPPAPAPSLLAEAPVSSRPSPTLDGKGPTDFCLNRFLSPLEAMSGRKLPQSPPEASWLSRVERAASALRQTHDLAPTEPIETIIATVADPVESGLDYQFESELRALELGVEHSSASALYRDREWLPWDDRALGDASRREAEGCRTSTPGIVLFRGDRGRLLALLLVGESPATGLREATLLNALDVGKVLEHGAPAYSDPTQDATIPRVVRIVGPTFSGSAASLRMGLAQWAHEHPGDLLSFRIVTGSATGADVASALGESGALLGKTSSVSFRTTTGSDPANICAYLWFLRNRLSVEPTGDGGELRGVAMLRESGTEFGSGRDRSGRSCKWAPAATLNFPFHVSALRDAYEHMSAPRQDAAIARRTSLPASLHEKHVPLDIEAELSDKTKAALDLTLTSILGQISRNDVRDVAINATDVGDAIFLAQRIRDVAPDVRLAFFDADALLVAPEYRRELLGSLVVTPYPFLGVHPFAGSRPGPMLAFESSMAEGVYNAIIAQRGGGVDDLRDYTFDEGRFPIPVWVSTLGRDGIVPLSVAPSPDCNGHVYGTQFLERTRKVCDKSKPTPGTWAAFNSLRVADFSLNRELHLPHLWDIAYVVLLFGFFIDLLRQNGLSRIFYPGDGASALDDQALDRVITRAKWRLYATIRTFLFVLAFSYMACVYGFSCVARGELLVPIDSHWLYVGAIVVVVAGTWGIAVWRVWGQWLLFFSDFRRLVGKVGGFWPWSAFRAHPLRRDDSKEGNATDSILATSVPASGQEARKLLERFSLRMGAAEPCDSESVVRVSFAQLRWLTAITVLLALWFMGCVVLDAIESTDSRLALPGMRAVPAMTLLVLRNTTLSNGVSSAAAALLCMICVYVWCVGRMARLALAYRAAQQCPADGVADLVSTPIRLVLHPNAKARPGSQLVFGDDGFTAVERNVLNAIFRPITGPYYPIAAAALALAPVVLFTLKRVRTIESLGGHLLLESGLGLCVVLIGSTLIQLVQYWVALEGLLKRTMEHRLGPAFRQVAAFARDSIDHLVSRSTNDVLRWTAATRQFTDLVASAADARLVFLVGDHRADLRAHSCELERHRSEYLERKRQEPETPAKCPPEAALGQELIAAASLVMTIVASKWAQAEVVASELPAPPASKATASESGEPRSQALVPHPPPSRRSASRSGLATAPNSRAADDEDRLSDVVPSTRATGAAPPDEDTGTRALPGIIWSRNSKNDEAPVESKPAADDAFTSMSFRYEKPELAWLRAAEAFIVTVVTLLVHRHVRQFRYFLYVLTACSLLLLAAVTSYPFEPYRLMLTFAWVIIGTVVGTCLWVYIELERNTLLSHTAGTEPNTVRFDGAFALRLLTWGAIPLLSVAATQYPELANFLFNLFAPFSRALH